MRDGVLLKIWSHDFPLFVCVIWDFASWSLTIMWVLLAVSVGLDLWLVLVLPITCVCYTQRMVSHYLKISTASLSMWVLLTAYRVRGEYFRSVPIQLSSFQLRTTSTLGWPNIMSRYLILVPVDKFLSSITPRTIYCFYLAYYGTIFPGISISPVFAPVIIIILPNFLSLFHSEVDLSPFFGRHIRYFGLSLSVYSDVFRLVRFV